MTATHPSRRVLLVVYGALLLLLGAAVGVAFLELGMWGTILGLAIAGVKATLVGLYFMHLRYATPTARLFAVAGLFWLGILLTITMADVLTRG